MVPPPNPVVAAGFSDPFCLWVTHSIPEDCDTQSEKQAGEERSGDDVEDVEPKHDVPFCFG
jgi:hypothetical protein